MSPNNLIFPVEWKLTKSHRLILAALLYSPLEIVTTEALFEAVYWNKAADDRPSIRQVQVMISYLRLRVPNWVKINNVQGIGYTIPRDIRKRLLDECNNALEELRNMLDTVPLSALQKLSGT